MSKDGVELARKVVVPGEYVIGRGEDVDFQMDTPLASRHHARLTVNYDEWLIEDLASANGTFINDRRLSPNETAKVFPTQTLRVGDATVTLRRLRDSAAPAASLPPGAATLHAVLPAEIRQERRYAIGQVVAQGGMGAILNAQDQTIRRGVAMKVMLQSGGSEDVLRFVEEAQITGQLEHPNIVPVYELGVDEQDQPFYTMKFVRGISLRKVLELLAQGVPETVQKYPLGVLLTIFQKVCDGLAFAHAKGVIHRDLKPENIMLGEYGEALVMDGGLAKVLGAQSRTGAAVHSARQENPANATLAGSVMGTPQYMAPEQAEGRIDELDARTDIYALGAILYQILTLQPPFALADIDTLLAAVRAGKTIPPVERVGAKRLPHLPDGAVPRSLAAVAMKALALQPAARYASVQDLQADIAAFQTGFATTAEQAGALRQAALFLRRHKIVSSAAAIILVLTVGFTAKVVQEGRRATVALTRLRGTAPTFAAQAGALVETKQFAEALEKIDFAVALQPDDAEFHVARANILQSLFRFEEARAAYVEALRLQPGHAFAKDSLALSDALAQDGAPPGTTPPTPRLNQLQALLRAQGRTAEAIALLRVFGRDKKAIYDTWRSALERAGITEKLEQSDDGFLSLNLTRSGIDSLEALRGMPLVYLNIALTKVSDLGPLTGMPLKQLNLTSCREVRDLTPLKGMKLVALLMDSVSVSNLEPLTGMPLETLWMQGTKVTDLGPLRGLPLRDLSIGGSPVSGLAPLQGMPLASLQIGNTQVSDLGPLKGMPLTSLSLLSAPVRDLSPLKNSKLTNLDIRATLVTDLTPLRGLPLAILLTQADRIPDFTPLRGLPLKKLLLTGAKIDDLSLVKGMPLEELILDKSTVSDISALRDHPTLRNLALNGTPVRDLTPLANCRKLEALAIPAGFTGDLEFLRRLPALQRLGTDWGTGTGVA